MILAVHGGDQTMGLAIAILVGIIKLLSWVSAKAKEKPAGKPAVSTEEERTRRFLEALGHAPGQPPPGPRRDAAASLRQQIPTGQTTRRPEPAARPVAPPAMPRHRTPLPPPPPALRQEAAWRVPPPPDLPELATPALPEFQTKASRVSALAGEKGMPEEPAATKDDPANALRTLLRSPSSLRAAFVLREVLGPPPGLPGSTTGPTLALS